MERKSSQPIELFYCYARKDHALRDELHIHLAGLRRSGLITTWYDGEISPGASWEEAIEAHLNTACVILLLVSPDFLHSDYCYSKEMARAIERHHAKETRVIPVLLRPADWTDTPLRTLQVLPSNAQPVTRWPDPDEAFEDVVRGIRQAVHDLFSQHIIASDSLVSVVPPKLPPQATLSLSSIESQPLRPSRHRILRRAFVTGMIGLVGLTGVSILGAIAWQTRLRVSSETAATSTAITNIYNHAVTANGIMFGFDSEHTHVNPYEQILNPVTVSRLTKRWAYQTGNGINSSPIVVDGVVYVGSQDGNLYALHAVSGVRKWAYPTGDMVVSSPAVVDGVVYVGSQNGNLYALDAVSGVRKWCYSTGNIINSSPAVVDGVVYVGSHDHNVYAIDAVLGVKKWAYPTEGVVDSSPAVVDGVVYVGSHDHNVYAIDAVSGVKKWTCLTGNAIESSPAVVGGVVYIGSWDHSLYAIDAVSGKEKWTYPTGNSIHSSPVVANGVIYVGSQDHSLYAIDAISGRGKWAYSTGNLIDSSPTVANGVVYVGSQDHNLYAFGLLD